MRVVTCSSARSRCCACRLGVGYCGAQERIARPRDHEGEYGLRIITLGGGAMAASHLGAGLASGPRGSRPRRLRDCFGGVTLAENSLALISASTNSFLADSAAAGLHPGRMSLATALGFFALESPCSLSRPPCEPCRHRPLADDPAAAHFDAGDHQLRLWFRCAVPSGSVFFHGAAYGLLALHPHASIVAAETSHGFARIATSGAVGGECPGGCLPTLPLMLFVLGSCACRRSGELIRKSISGWR